MYTIISIFICHKGQEIYDVPPSTASTTSGEQQQDIYDVPATHDVNRVMEEAYSGHKKQRNHNNNNLLAVPGVGGNGGYCEDDYVDYHDIWSKEPPKELVQQHAKVFLYNLFLFIYEC